MRGALLLAALALAGCGSGHRSAGACPGARLVLKQGSLISEATGQHTLQVLIVDRGAACTVDGVPNVELDGVNGNALHFSYKDTGDQMLPPAHPLPVRIARGWPAFVELNKYRCDIRAIDDAKTLLLTLPRLQPLRLRLRLRTYPILDWCPGEKQSRIVDVSAVYRLPPVARVHVGDSRRSVIALFGRPERAGPRCSVWRWAPVPGSGDGLRVCFRSGRATLVQTAVHG